MTIIVIGFQSCRSLELVSPLLSMYRLPLCVIFYFPGIDTR